MDWQSLGHTALTLGGAFLLGGLIGFERQWRQRLAGLRTNTLVALGAAIFVLFAGLFPGEASPTRVAAQIVSGIGFMGAGIIFKEGLNVRGLNTAATLWCSAAIGALCGAGFFFHALIATTFVIAVNAVLRPLVRLVERQYSPQARWTAHMRSASSAMERLRRMFGRFFFAISPVRCTSATSKARISRTQTESR